MSQLSIADALLRKADQAFASARVLLDLGDVDGACSRACYAMFDAARSALIASGAPIAPGIGKMHSGLIAAFGNHLIKHGQVPKEMGRLLNRALEIRHIADYRGDSAEFIDAQQLVEQARIFVAAMQSACRSR